VIILGLELAVKAKITINSSQKHYLENVYICLYFCCFYSYLWLMLITLFTLGGLVVSGVFSSCSPAPPVTERSRKACGIATLNAQRLVEKYAPLLCGTYIFWEYY
jgi:hypothetical protein